MRNPLRPLPARANLSIKFALLVAAIFGLALVALLLMQRTQRQSIADLLESETRERSAMLARVIELTGRALQDFTHDYAQWDDMVEFVQRPRPEWAAVNLDASLDNFKLSAAWVLRVDGSLVYATSGEAGAARPALPFDEATLRAVLAAPPAPSCFVQRPEGLVEVCFAPVLPSEDSKRITTPRGWLVAARQWDAAQLALLGELLQCEVAIAAAGRPLPAGSSNQISLRYPLPGPRGEPVADLIYTTRSIELAIVARHNRTQLWLFVVTGLVTAVLALTFLHGWVMRPLHAISESLARVEPGPILPLIEKTDELGRVAQLVQTSFAQRATLEEMLVERARLGRELHDGVIQTVFAAGMNLTGARAQLRQNPTEAERILDDTHAELNRTIRDLRSFIAGLEPEPTSERSLSEAIQSIVALMRGVRPIECVLEIDERVSRRLTGTQRLHLLHIVREAVSNSVRHSAATCVLIALRPGPAGAEIDISDDGAGLDPLTEGERGRGLANLSARARELGGSIRIEPGQAGAGMRIKLVFPMIA